MLKILKYLKPYRWGILAVFIFVSLRGVLDLLLPTILGLLVNEGIGLGDRGVDPNVRRIWELAGIMLGVITTSIIITIVSGFIETKISAGFAVRVRKAIYQKIEKFSLVELDHFTIASLITRSTNDIQQVQTFINIMLRMIILAPILAAGAIAFSIVQQPTLSLLLIASITSLVVMLAIIFAVTIPKFELVQKLVDRLNLVTRENLSGLRVVRAFNTEKYQAKRIDDASMDSMRLNVFVNRITGMMWPLMGLIMGLTSLGIVYFGSKYFIGVDGFNPGSMMALMQYAMRAIMAFMFITMMFVMLPRASISARRIMEVLNMPIQIDNPVRPLELPKNLKGEIIFKDVWFSYPDAKMPVLSGVSFTARPGKITAFIGSTGSGKSTLINLIPRFYEATKGSILIDGMDITDLELKDLYSLLGYVPQAGVLFSGSIKNNILFGTEETEGLLEEATAISQLKEYINDLEDGYDHQISQRGANVSGGQRQRLSIARAIAKKPLVYIFDDSFSALDYQTDQKVRKILSETIHATKIIVAQRINTIRSADQIIVLNEGKIVGKGTHDELMSSCIVYQEIASSQLTKEEL